MRLSIAPARISCYNSVHFDQKEPFMSQEDISLRCGKASTAVVQSLRDIGALGDLPESNQLDLFAAMF